MCSYCPQDKILGAYTHPNAGGHMMELETFEKCLGRLPPEVDVHFSGFTEAWLNPACTDMVHLAQSRGHQIFISSTLSGMTLDDVDRLETIAIRKFTIHLPADDGSMTLEVDDAYVAVLEGLLRGPLSVRCRFHGKRMHPRVAEIVKRGSRGDLHTRAGNLANQPKPTWLRGEITCRRDPVQHVLLPNGDVVLCCMDWSMKHRLGNLLDTNYDALVAGPEMQRVLSAWKDESQDVLCRVCDKHAADVDLRAKALNTWLPRLLHRVGL